MRIEEIDSNLKVETNITESDIIWLDAKQAPFTLSGVEYDADYGYVRMPQDIAKTVSEGVNWLSKNTSGGRIRFKTDTSFIAIKAVMENCDTMPHFTLAGQSGFDLYRKDENGNFFCHTFLPPVGMKKGYSSFTYTDGKFNEYTLNFPLYDRVKELYIALKKDAHIVAPDPYINELPVVFYGSSITQGGCASRPGNSYQAILSRHLNIDYINLGFSGSCRGEKAMIDYLCDLPMSVFVCDYDHNAPNLEHLKQTHLPIYRAIRERHPELPIIFISAPDVLRAPSPFEARREVVRETYNISLKKGDKYTRFIDGGELFAGKDWDSCTVDGCHPNDLGFLRMADRIEKELKEFI